MRLPARSAGARVGAPSPPPSLCDYRLIARLRRLAQQEGGFTIVEVIVATVVLIVGLLTAYLMLAVAVHSSSDVRQREEGVSLARQITEDARSIPYAQLSNSTIVTMLQAMPGLANTSSGSTWTVMRPSPNGITYTISASLTNLNDPKDTSGGTDIKQFGVTVSWNTYQGAQHQFTETAIMSRAGEDPGLAASNLSLATPAWGTAGLSGSMSAPVISSTGITSLTFSVTAPAGTTAIVWTLNGVKQSAWAGSPPGSGTTWTSTAWSLSGVSDTTYTVGAQAEDSSGIDGPSVTIPVRLIRSIPSAPVLTGYGFNTNLLTGGGGVTAGEIQWTPNPERNVTGYRIYSPVNNYSSPICQLSTASSFPSSCSVNGGNVWCTTLTACVDLNPPAVNAGNLTYKVVALYFDINNTLQEGHPASFTMTSGAPAAPGPPTGLLVTPQLDGSAILTWVPPVGGTTVSFYRIYRDGNTYTSRYDTLAASSCSATCSYHDTSRSEAHQYYVTAVGGTTLGSDMAESTQAGPQAG